MPGERVHVNHMASMMSNALSVLVISAAAVGLAGPGRLTVSLFMTRLIGAGMCVLVAWCAWRAIRPAKLLLVSPPGRRNTLTVLHVLILYLVYLVVSGGLYQALSRTIDGDSRPQVLSMLVAQPCMLIFGTIMAAYTFPLGLRRGLGLTARHWLNDTFRGILGYLAVLPVCTGLLALSVWILPQGLQKEHQALVLLGLKGLPPVWKAMAVFGAVILAPLAEEVFFRGLLQSMVRRYTTGAWPAIIISSVVFAAMHWHTPQNIVSLLALGIVLGYSYEYTGRLYRPILIHALFNAVAVADRLMGL